ncbi:MAG: DUF1318 domain-containing protein [Betaproteobacteria bacterium]
MKFRGCLLLVVSLLLLAGCESTPTHLFTYAAQGTVIQAERYVGMVFGREVWPLPYGGAAIDQPLQRMQTRFPQLRAQLDAGVLGLTADGEVELRESDSSSPEILSMVRDENRDRAVFYVGMAVAVGHGQDNLPSWLPYVKATFGGEWQKNAPSGWYLRNSQGEWRRQS